MLDNLSDLFLAPDNVRECLEEDMAVMTVVHHGDSYNGHSSGRHSARCCLAHDAGRHAQLAGEETRPRGFEASPAFEDGTIYATWLKLRIFCD